MTSEHQLEPEVKTIEKGSPAASEYDVDRLALERKTMRRVDFRIVPISSLLYSFAMIDRVNLGAAYTAGMGTSLKLAQGGRFNLVICLFFVPYVLIQLPANLILRKVGVRNWLTFIVVSWGAVQLGMSFVTDWRELLLCRMLLGAFEASFLPSILFIMATWYKRHEIQTRIAFFAMVTIIAGGVSPLLAYACRLLNDKGGLAGWRWIFVVEGLITLLLGSLTWFFIPDFPDQNKFLTSEQTALVLQRIDEDRGDAVPDNVTAGKVRKYLSDWTIWAYGFMFFCAIMPNYSQAYFLPVILKEMGWSETQALLLSAPPYLLSVVALVVAYVADKHKHRAGFIVLTAVITIAGISLLAFANQNSVRYFGAFLTNAGNAGCIPTVFAYAANNVVFHSKRSVQTAVQVSLGGIGAIVGTVAYRSQDAPRFIPGLSVTLGSQVLLVIIVLVTTTHFMRQNKMMREGKRTEYLEGQKGFYYTL